MAGSTMGTRASSSTRPTPSGCCPTSRSTAPPSAACCRRPWAGRRSPGSSAPGSSSATSGARTCWTKTATSTTTMTGSGCSATSSTRPPRWCPTRWSRSSATWGCTPSASTRSMPGTSRWAPRRWSTTPSPAARPWMPMRSTGGTACRASASSWWGPMTGWCTRSRRAARCRQCRPRRTPSASRRRMTWAPARSCGPSSRRTCCRS